MPKKSKEKFKVRHSVFDNFTNRTLFRLISKGIIRGLESPISVGKESNVFTARDHEDKLLIVKIYRLETCDFNKMHEYISDDERYANMRMGKRKVIFAWVQREYKNLCIAKKAKISSPEPITFLNNIIVEECIHTKEDIAPKLKDKPPKNNKLFFNRIIRDMKRLYDFKIVHADLSSFNILNHDEKPVFIDFSQSTTLKHSQATLYLKRDVHNIITFFKKYGYIADKEKILNKITR